MEEKHSNTSESIKMSKYKDSAGSGVLSSIIFIVFALAFMAILSKFIG